MSRVIEIQGLEKTYTLKTGLFNQLRGNVRKVRAVNNVNLTIKTDEILGLVGESGCGKTTLAKMLMHIEPVTSGKIMIDGKDYTYLDKDREMDFRRKMQLVFQDPYDSLDPRYTVREILAEPLRHLGPKPLSPIEEKDWIENALREVELLPIEEYINRYPHQLSGGQRQRVAIARAIIIKPEFLVADEPVSMLDVSIRAGILNLIKKKNEENGIGCLLVTHDLATARYLCHRIAVMYLGKIVEVGSAKNLMEDFVHPYSRLLLTSAPDLYLLEEDEREEIPTIAMDAVDPPEGCKFAPRCPNAKEFCWEKEPILNDRENKEGHQIACHLCGSNVVKNLEKIDL